MKPYLLAGSGLDVTLPRLRVRGQFFELADGTHWTCIEATSFQLLQRLLNGEDVTPVLDQLADIGFNTVRVLGMCDLMFHLYPQEHGDDYWNALVTLSHLCAARGLYVELTAFADATRVMPNLPDQLTHWAVVQHYTQPLTNVFVELVNENDQSINAIQTDAFPRLMGVLCSHGSNGSAFVGTIAPPQPAWDYEVLHWNAASEWQRKCGKDSMDYALRNGHPTRANENPRCDDEEGSVDRWRSAGQCMALMCEGGCFHSILGKQSALLTGHQFDCAKAFCEGAHSIDLSVQDIEYDHRKDLEKDASGNVIWLRVYEKSGQFAWVAL